MAMPFTVIAMHEDMHDWTGEQQQKWQGAQRVGAVLAEKKKGSDCDKAPEHPVTQRCFLMRLLRLWMFVCHGFTSRLLVSAWSDVILPTCSGVSFAASPWPLIPPLRPAPNMATSITTIITIMNSDILAISSFQQ